MVEQWAERAHDIVETWPDDLAAAPPDWKTLETHATIAAAHVREAGGDGRQDAGGVRR
jgi:hypothetical protein